MFRENIAMLNHKNIFEEIDNYELVLEELSNSKDNTKQTLHNWNQTAKNSASTIHSSASNHE